MTLRLLLDECCPHSLLPALNALGHDVAHWAHREAGALDETVLASAWEQQRILVTFDNDFGDLVVRRGAVALGVMIAAANGPPSEQVARVVAAVRAFDKALLDNLTIVGVHRSKQRRITPAAGPPAASDPG